MSPIGPFGLMRRLFDDLAQLAGIGNEPGPEQKEQAQGAEGMMFAPRVDVTRRDGKLVVQVDLPGVAAKNISAVIDDDALIIEGERRASSRKATCGAPSASTDASSA